MEKKKLKILKSFDEVVEEVKKRNYSYIWRPEYLEDLAEGPRCCACAGVPASEGADLMLKEYDIRIDQERCIKCGACWVLCPLGVIYQEEDGSFIIDEEYCRACGVCIEECPAEAIEMTKIIR